MKGRQLLWVQSALANITLQNVADGVFSDVIIEPAQWEREVRGDTKVSNRPGGTRLEAMYLDIQFTLRDDTTPFPPHGVELMVHSQTTASVPVASEANFLARFADQRVLIYDATSLRSSMRVYPQNNFGVFQSAHGQHRWHMKSRVRLPEKEVVCTVMFRADLTGYDEAGVQVGYRAILSTP